MGDAHQQEDGQALPDHSGRGHGAHGQDSGGKIPAQIQVRGACFDCNDRLTGAIALLKGSVLRQTWD